jgi:hypothetical protein
MPIRIAHNDDLIQGDACQLADVAVGKKTSSPETFRAGNLCNQSIALLT